MKLLPFLKRRLVVIAGAAAACIAIAVLAFVFFGSNRRLEPLLLQQKVSAQSVLRMEFPVKMKKESVEEFLDLPPTVTGTLKWDGETLVFDPASNLVAGKEYVFTVPRGTVTDTGQTLTKDIVFSFSVSGEPALAATVPPQGTTNVPADTQITLIFDRPMVALSTVDARQENASTLPLSLEPKTDGRWRWLSTYAVEFVPAKSLLPSQQYKVIVPAGLTTVGGDKTAKDFSWQFETARPDVLSIDPSSSESAGPSSKVTITFNQEMDPATARNFISIEAMGNVPVETSSVGTKPELTTPSPAGVVPPEGERPRQITTTRTGTPVAIGSIVYGQKLDETTNAMVQDRNTLVITPKEPFAFGTSYTVKVAKDIHGKNGDLGSAAAKAFSFNTVGPLQVADSKFEYSQLMLRFTSPIASGSLMHNLNISPKPENWPEDPSTMLDVWSTNQVLNAWSDWAPSTEYTVTLTTGVKDIFNQSLSKPFSFSFKTPPLHPAVSINAISEFGIFEKNKPPVYHVNAVNVSTLNLQLAKIPFTQFLSDRLASRTNYAAVPDFSKAERLETWQVKPQTNKLDTRGVNEINLEQKWGAALQSGLYGFTATAPEYTDQYNGTKLMEKQFFALTNMALTLKYTGTRTFVWVTDIRTGEPVKNAVLTFYSLSGTSPLKGTTDDKGYFESNLPLGSFVAQGNEWQPEFYVTAEKDGDFAFVGSQWSDGWNSSTFDGWTDFQGVGTAPHRVNAFIHTDRPLYMAGDTVYLRAITRLRDWNGGLQIPAKGKTSTIMISDPSGKQVFEKTLGYNDFGSVFDSFVLGTDAALGQYQVNLRHNPETDATQESTWATFSVLAYRKPEYKVELTADKNDYFTGDTATVTISGQYYFGAPMQNSKVKWRAQFTDYYFNKETDGWYSFALEDMWCWFACERDSTPLTEGTGTLDAAGRLTIKVPLDIRTMGVSQILTVEADILDKNNQSVSNRVSVPVHKSNVYVGVKTRDYITTPGSKAGVDIIALRPDGTFVQNQAVTVRLFSRVWNTVRSKGVDGQFYYDNTPKDTFIRDMSATTNSNGKATVEVPIDKGGEYRIVVIAKDEQGRESRAGTSIYSWSSTYVNWPHSNTNQLDITTDKPSYKPGETAKLLVKSPFQGKGVKALVTVEREQIVSKWTVDVTSNALPIDIPVTDQMIPNAYVSVVIVKPRNGETFNDNGLDTGVPAFRIGYSTLKVDSEKKTLNISITTDKEKYLPGEKVNVTIKTSSNNKPVSAELALSTVDMSLLALTGFETPDLVNFFYTKRGLGVMTSNMLTYLIERYKPGSKGGGGDGDTRQRGNFKDTAYWNPSIITNEQGVATVSFPLPDNLTTWKLLAVGSTKDNTFGANDKDILETKNVIARQVRPRFAVRGDKIQFGGIVQNLTDQTKTFTVSLSGSGFISTGKRTETMTLKKGEQGKVTFPIEIGNADKATTILSAVTDTARDVVQESFPVHAFGVDQSVATSGNTTSAAEEAILVPRKDQARDGTLTVTLAPSMAAYLPAGLDYLLTYPYGCTEQTVSSFLSIAAMKPLASQDVLKVPGVASIDTRISEGLQRLYGLQRADGSFGFWKESTEANTFLTAYALYGMHIAKTNGVTVDATVMKKASDYLDTVLRNQKDKSIRTVSDRSYVLFVLAETGRTDINLLNNLLQSQKDMPLHAKAQLAMAFDKEGSMASKNHARDLMKDILATAKVDPRGAHFEEENPEVFDPVVRSNTRTTALVAQAMVRMDRQNPLLQLLLRYILAVRQDGHWDTTQSTSASLISLIEYAKVADNLNGTVKGSVLVNQSTILEGQFGKTEKLSRKETALDLKKLVPDSTNSIFVKAEGGRMYYDLLFSYFATPDVITAEEEGISIGRTMETFDGAPVTTSAAKLGDTYRIRLTVTVPADRHYVAVTSPLPAGFEAIDTQLQTTRQLYNDEEQPEEGTVPKPILYGYMYAAYGSFTHREFRDDELFLFAEHLPAGVYQYEFLARATTPGTYRYRPSRAWEMYYPEVFGQSSGEWFTVNP